jgi:hypothetical protein
VIKRVGKILPWTVGCIAGLIILIILVYLIFYPPQYVYRVLVWQESDVYDYLNNFPNRSLEAASMFFYFDKETDDERITHILETILDIDDLDSFLETLRIFGEQLSSDSCFKPEVAGEYEPIYHQASRQS